MADPISIKDSDISLKAYIYFIANKAFYHG